MLLNITFFWADIFPAAKRSANISVRIAPYVGADLCQAFTANYTRASTIWLNMDPNLNIQVVWNILGSAFTCFACGDKSNKLMNRKFASRKANWHNRWTTDKRRFRTDLYAPDVNPIVGTSRACRCVNIGQFTEYYYLKSRHFSLKN